MTPQQFIEASKVVAWLAEHAATPGEQAEKRAQMALSLVLAQSYLVEYASHATRGLEPYDALMATVSGELELPASQKDLLRALMPPPAGTPE